MEQKKEFLQEHTNHSIRIDIKKIITDLRLDINKTVLKINLLEGLLWGTCDRVDNLDNEYLQQENEQNLITTKKIK